MTTKMGAECVKCGKRRANQILLETLEPICINCEDIDMELTFLKDLGLKEKIAEVHGQYVADKVKWPGMRPVFYRPTFPNLYKLEKLRKKYQCQTYSELLGVLIENAED